MKVKHVGITIIVVLILFACVSFWAVIQISLKPVLTSKQPVLPRLLYADYQFSHDPSVVVIGIQPLWMPASIIAEVMKHDRILRDALYKEGLRMHFIPFYKGADINYFMQEGDIDVGVGGDMPALTAAGLCDATVTSLVQEGFCSVVTKEAVLIPDLAGKKIGYAVGSNAHYALMESLNAFGLTEADVVLVPLDVNEMPIALDCGEVDAFCAWEPTPTVACHTYEGQRVMYRVLSKGYLYFAHRFAEKYPDSMRHIVAAQIRAVRWLQQDYTHLLRACQWTIIASQAFAPHVPTLGPEELAVLAWTDILGIMSTPLISKQDLIAGGALYREIEFLLSNGKLPSRIAVSDIIDKFEQNIVKNVMMNPQTYNFDTFMYEEK